MAELHAVPPSEPPEPDRRMTAARYRSIWSTAAGTFAFLTVFALLDVLPVIAYGLITLFLVGVIAFATVRRTRQLRRNRDEWGQWPS